MYVLLPLAIWVGWGVLVAFLKVFVYFRGPKHMVQCYLNMPGMEKMGQKMQKDCKERYGMLFLIILLSSVLLPPLMTIELILEVSIFGF
jgi:cobalamin synthase